MPDLIKCSILCLAEVLQNLVGNFVWNIAASHKTALIYSQIRRCIRILRLGYQTIIAINLLSFPKQPKSLFTIPSPITRLERQQNLCNIVSNALFVTLSFPKVARVSFYITHLNIGLIWGRFQWTKLAFIEALEYLFTLRTPIGRPCTNGNGRAVSGLARPPGCVMSKWRNGFNVILW